MDVIHGRWMSGELKDMLGRPYKVGDTVARAFKSGQAVNVELIEVTRIENDKMYMGGAKVPVNYPGRFLIVNEQVVITKSLLDPDPS